MAKPGPPTLTDPYAPPPDSDAAPAAGSRTPSFALGLRPAPAQVAAPLAPARKNAATHTIPRFSLGSPVAAPTPRPADPVPLMSQPVPAAAFSPQPVPAAAFSPQPVRAVPFSPQPVATNPFSPQPVATNPFSPQPAPAIPFAPQPAPAIPLSAPHVSAPVAPLLAPPSAAHVAPPLAAPAEHDPARTSAPSISYHSIPEIELQRALDAPAAAPGDALAREAPEPRAPAVAKPSRKRRKRRTWLAVTVTLAALVASGAALVGGMWLLDHREVPIFPQDEIGTLPDTTAQYSRYHLHGSWFQADQPEEAAWSRLAHDLCGGNDIYQLLMDAQSERRAVAQALDDRRHTGKALECGRAVAGSLGRSVYVVRTPIVRRADKRPDHDELPRRVGEAASGKKTRPERLATRAMAVYQLNIDQLPATTSWFIEQRERGGLEGTRCVAEKNKDGCSRAAQASARLEKTDLWVSGPLSDIERFGREFAADGANQVDHEKKFLALAEGLGELPNVTLGTHDTFDMWFLLNLGLRLNVTSFFDSESSITLLASISRYEAGWSLALTEGPERGEMMLRFHVDESDNAIDLALDLKEWKAALKEELLAQEEAALPDAELELKGVERRARKARHAVASRAIKNAEIERLGKLVTMTFRLEPDEDEQSDIDDMTEELKERAAASAEIVRGLIAGDRPDEHLLRELGGSELVDAVKDPERRDLPE